VKTKKLLSSYFDTKLMVFGQNLGTGKLGCWKPGERETELK